jgi:ribosomal-protein-alanine N-acetyltransferase
MLRGENHFINWALALNNSELFHYFVLMLNLDFPSFPVLETERLVLRQQTADDAYEVFRLRSDAEVNKHLDRPRAHTIEDAVKHIERITGLLNNKEWIGWGITLKDDPKLIGGIGVWKFSHEENIADIGYELLPAYHRKGIVKEAMKKIIEFARETMKVKKLTATTVAENLASVAVLRNFGFQLNPDFRDGNEREIQYVLDLE